MHARSDEQAIEPLCVSAFEVGAHAVADAQNARCVGDGERGEFTIRQFVDRRVRLPGPDYAAAKCLVVARERAQLLGERARAQLEPGALRERAFAKRKPPRLTTRSGPRWRVWLKPRPRKCTCISRSNVFRFTVVSGLPGITTRISGSSAPKAQRSCSVSRITIGNSYCSGGEYK